MYLQWLQIVAVNIQLGTSEYRRRGIMRTVAWGAMAKVVALCSSLLMVSLAMRYLGTEDYGLWVAVSSMMALLGFLDGGFGNAIVNVVAYSSAQRNEQQLKRIVSSAVLVLLAVSSLGLLAFLYLQPKVPWAWLFGLTISRGAINALVLVIGIGFFVMMVVSVVSRVQRGLQLGHLDAIAVAVGGLFSLILAGAAIALDAGLIGFAVAGVAGPILAQLVNAGIFLFRRPSLRPSVASFDVDIARQLARAGGMFFVLQLTSLVQLYADNLILAHWLGPAAVAPYDVCMKLFLIVPFFAALVATPLWPAYREALASGDAGWIRRSFRRHLGYSLAAGLPFALALAWLAPLVIPWWTGTSLMLSPALVLGCMVWSVMLLLGSVLSALLNGLQQVRLQVIVASVAGMVNVGISIPLVLSHGIAGAVWGSVIAYGGCALLPYLWWVPRILRRL